MSKEYFIRDSIATIHLNQFKQNIKNIKKLVGEKVAIMAVVKANGYGHGAIRMAEVLLEENINYLAVATLSEAIELRKNLDPCNILIMGHTPDRLLDLLVDYDITQTIFSYHQGALIDEYSARKKKKSKIHVKIDTGFHRLGYSPSVESSAEIVKLFGLSNILPEGIFTHLALVNEQENHKQYLQFRRYVQELASLECNFKYYHMADSIATVDSSHTRLNMVRLGALLYGMKGFHKGFVDVKPILTLTTKISQLHKINHGEGVGYDYKWIAPEDSIIATLPIGYADGLPRVLSNGGYVIVEGYIAPIIGTICMDQCMVNVTHIPCISTNSQVVVYGNGADGSMTIERVAQLAGTNKNDILTRISSRIPRRYLE